MATNDSSFPSGCTCKELNQHNKPRIPRPKNAFIIFRQYQQSYLPSSVPTTEKSRIIGDMWKKLTPEEKEYWMDLSAKEKRLHKLMYPDYKYSQTKKKNPLTAIVVCDFCTVKEKELNIMSSLSSEKQQSKPTLKDHGGYVVQRERFPLAKPPLLTPPIEDESSPTEAAGPVPTLPAPVPVIPVQGHVTTPEMQMQPPRGPVGGPNCYGYPFPPYAPQFSWPNSAHPGYMYPAVAPVNEQIHPLPMHYNHFQSAPIMRSLPPLQPNVAVVNGYTQPPVGAADLGYKY